MSAFWTTKDPEAWRVPGFLRYLALSQLDGDPPERCVYDHSAAQPHSHTLRGPQLAVPTFEWIPRIHGIGLLVHCDLSLAALLLLTLIWPALLDSNQWPTA